MILFHSLSEEIYNNSSAGLNTANRVRDLEILLKNTQLELKEANRELKLLRRTS